MTRSLRVQLSVSLFCLLACATTLRAQSASDNLSYELASAEIDSEASPPNYPWIIVLFGEGFPKQYLSKAQQTFGTSGEWQVELRDRQNPGSVKIIDVRQMSVAANPATSRIVSIDPGESITPATHMIRVRFLQGNFPEATIGEPKKSGTKTFYGAAKGKDDADLYFKGLVVTKPDASPTYTIDAKAAFYARLTDNRGAVGARMSYSVDKASDLGPDSITANISYSKVFVFGPATGLLLDVDAVGFEVDSENETRNFTSAAQARAVIPSVRIGSQSFGTVEGLLGYEIGENHKNQLQADLNTFRRTVAGANAYLLVRGVPIFSRIDVSASWKARWLTDEEPFTDSTEGAVPMLSTRTRHMFTLAAELMVNKALGFSIAHKHGSEPPKFEHVRHRTELGLVLKLKQVNKG
jgi:hypothetical protein